MGNLSQQEAFNLIQKKETESLRLEREWEKLLEKASDIDEYIQRLREKYNLHD